MRIAYQYRLRPNREQIATIEMWLGLLRRQYNYRLFERFSWWEDNRNTINACPLNTPIPQLRDNPDYYSQKRDLINTKQKLPEYQQIHSQVLQDCIKRVKLAFTGVRPTQIKQDCIEGKRINLPKIEWVKLIQHRPIPEVFKIKTATLCDFISRG